MFEQSSDKFFFRIKLLIKGLFILPLGVFGIMHFVLPDFFLHMVPRFMSFPSFWVNFSGICLLSASLAIFFNLWIRATTLLLILFVLVFILTVDIPNIFIPENGEQNYFIISLLKDTSLLGGSAFILLLDWMKKQSGLLSRK